jgi:hypothetical protein
MGEKKTHQNTLIQGVEIGIKPNIKRQLPFSQMFTNLLLDHLVSRIVFHFGRINWVEARSI